MLMLGAPCALILLCSTLIDVHEVSSFIVGHSAIRTASSIRTAHKTCSYGRSYNSIVTTTTRNTISCCSITITFSTNDKIKQRSGCSLYSAQEDVSWSPQDLTQNNDGYKPIPDNDYVKHYQSNPQLWPVEFFVIPYRKTPKPQVLVRPSANGTSKWGLGTGVPATRWMLFDNDSSSALPYGYKWSDSPKLTIHASQFPEYSSSTTKNDWTYRKIDMCDDAFTSTDAIAMGLQNVEIEQYAIQIRDLLQLKLESLFAKQNSSSSWESIRLSAIKKVVDNTNCIAAIQGTLRMSGLVPHLRNVIPDPKKVVESMQIYTMWPQMPDPMPDPATTSTKQLQDEIVGRPEQMTRSGRNPHMDTYGRVYTHISTSNVSNTIHGVYLTIDLTGLIQDDDDDTITGFDLFGMKDVQKEWQSLQNLCVVDDEGRIGTTDTKSTFISGFIVRQLIRDGIISL